MLRLDDNYDAHQELYSEVLSLRKELVMVQEDEARLRAQLENIPLHKAALKPELTNEWNTVEDKAAESPLKEVWDKQMIEQAPERMDWSTVDISDLYQRARTARKDFQKLCKKAEGMLRQKNKKVEKNAARNEELKESLQDAFDEEMENLRDAREKLRQIEIEERYHYRRGTGNRREKAVKEERVEMAQDNRRGALENDIIRHVAELQYENEDLKEEVRRTDCVLADMSRISEERDAKVKTELQHIEDEGSEAREVLERLRGEEERVARVREDLHRTLLYVRAHHKIA